MTASQIVCIPQQLIKVVNEATKQKDTKMKTANINLDTMYNMGSEIRTQDVINFAGSASKRNVRAYMKACITAPDNGKIWVGDDLLPIGNLQEAIDAAVRGFNDYNEA